MSEVDLSSLSLSNLVQNMKRRTGGTAKERCLIGDLVGLGSEQQLEELEGKLDVRVTTAVVNPSM